MRDATTLAGTPPGPDRHRRPEAIHGLARDWWLFALRGVVAIAFGAVALLNPVAGLIGLLSFIAAWMLVDGVFTLWQAITGPRERQGVWFWLDGILSLLAAAVIFLAPGLSTVALVLVAGAWWAATGVVEIIAAFRRGSLLLGLAGLASLALGVLVLLAPGPGLLWIVWYAAAMAILFGALMISTGLRLRRVAQDPAAVEREFPSPAAHRHDTTEAVMRDDATMTAAAATPLAAGAASSPAVAPGATSAIAPTAIPAVGAAGTGAPGPASLAAHGAAAGLPGVTTPVGTTPARPGPGTAPANDPVPPANDTDAAADARRAAAATRDGRGAA